jgi:hypothetical protein
MAELAAPNLKNCSFTITAHLTVPQEGAQGVVICQGGNMAGWSLYLDDRSRPTYHYNRYDRVHTSVAAADPVPVGDVTLSTTFTSDGGIGAGGDVQLLVDGREVGTGRVDHTVPFLFSMSGETMDVGVDTGSAVGPYPNGNRFTGTIHRVEIELHDQLTPEDLQTYFQGQAAAAAAQH